MFLEEKEDQRSKISRRVNEFLDAGKCQILKALVYKAAKMKQKCKKSSFTF